MLLENAGQTIQKLNTPKKANHAKHSKTKLPSLVAMYDTQTGNETSLFYNAPVPSPHGAQATNKAIILENI